MTLEHPASGRRNGLRTGFVSRPDEFGNGSAGVPDQVKPGDFGIVSVSSVDMARQMDA